MSLERHQLVRLKTEAWHELIAAAIRAGGAARPSALADATALHAEFVARRLSPGGSADLLAAACAVDRWSLIR